MKRRTFLKLGTGTLVGSALAACGGGGHDGGRVQPDPPPQGPRPAAGSRSAMHSEAVADATGADSATPASL